MSNESTPDAFTNPEEACMFIEDYAGSERSIADALKYLRSQGLITTHEHQRYSAHAEAGPQLAREIASLVEEMAALGTALAVAARSSEHTFPPHQASVHEITAYAEQAKHIAEALETRERDFHMVVASLRIVAAKIGREEG